MYHHDDGCSDINAIVSVSQILESTKWSLSDVFDVKTEDTGGKFSQEVLIRSQDCSQDSSQDNYQDFSQDSSEDTDGKFSLEVSHNIYEHYIDENMEKFFYNREKPD